MADPPRCRLYSERPAGRSTFRRYYERGVFPVAVESDGAGHRLIWRTEHLEELDFHFYLPLFFDGLTEARMPYSFLVEQGVADLLEAGGSVKALDVLPKLIQPIKSEWKERDGKFVWIGDGDIAERV